MRVNRELAQLSVSFEDQRQAVREQEATILGLQQAPETAHSALETEKKRVEGEPSFSAFHLSAWLVCLGYAPNSVLCFWFSGLRTSLGNSVTQAQAVQTAYNSSQQELEELRAVALEACLGVKEGKVQAGSSMASRLRALSRHATQRVRRALHLGV
jgi:hypothetical protein